MLFSKSKDEKPEDLDSHAQSLETLRFLYPIFKEEVYRRRAAMSQIARLGVFFYLALTFWVSFFSGDFITKPELRYWAMASIFLSVILLIYQITQEKSRHEKAKLQLITLERGFGFFEAERHMPNQPLYPSEWQDRPKVDSGLVLMCLLLAGTAAILIFAVFSV